MRPFFLFKSEKKTDEGHLKQMRDQGPEKHFLFGLKCFFFSRDYHNNECMLISIPEQKVARMKPLYITESID